MDLFWGKACSNTNTPTTSFFFPAWCSFLRDLHVVSKQTTIANSNLAATRHMSGQTANTAGDFTWKGISPLALTSSSLLLKPQV